MFTAFMAHKRTEMAVSVVTGAITTFRHLANRGGIVYNRGYKVNILHDEGQS